MKDIFNNEILVGMDCAFNPPIYKGLKRGKVLKITAKQVRVSYSPDGKQSTNEFCVYPRGIVVKT